MRFERQGWELSSLWSVGKAVKIRRPYVLLDVMVFQAPRMDDTLQIEALLSETLTRQGWDVEVHAIQEPEDVGRPFDREHVRRENIVQIRRQADAFLRNILVIEGSSIPKNFYVQVDKIVTITVKQLRAMGVEVY